jgi:hypothetical protein
MYDIIEVFLIAKWFDLFGDKYGSKQPRKTINNFIGSYIKGDDKGFSKNDGAGPYYVLLFLGKLKLTICF